MNDIQHAIEMNELGDPIAATAIKTYTPKEAYIEDCRRRPFYHDGGERKTWEQLSEYARKTWEKNPRPRHYSDFTRTQPAKPAQNIYTENGYKSRADYLKSLADDYGISLDAVHALAIILGPSEDFDGLVTAVQDASE